MSRHERTFDWRRALLHGIELAAENYHAYADSAPWTAMWELLCEAARISHASEGPPRSGFPEKAAWPDAPDEITPWQRQMDYLRGTLDEVRQDEPTPPMPTAAEVTRADAVLGLWHRHALWRGAYPHPCKRHIYRLACGESMGAVIRLTGLRRPEVLGMEQRACRQMLDAAGVAR